MSRPGHGCRAIRVAVGQKWSQTLLTKDRRIREPPRVALSVWQLRARVGDTSSLVQASPRRSRECRDEPSARTSPTSRPPPRVATRRVVANRDRSTVALAMA